MVDEVLEGSSIIAPRRRWKSMIHSAVRKRAADAVVGCAAGDLVDGVEADPDLRTGGARCAQPRGQAPVGGCGEAVIERRILPRVVGASRASDRGSWAY